MNTNDGTSRGLRFERGRQHLRVHNRRSTVLSHRLVVAVKHQEVVAVQGSDVRTNCCNRYLASRQPDSNRAQRAGGETSLIHTPPGGLKPLQFRWNNRAHITSPVSSSSSIFPARKSGSLSQCPLSLA